MKLAASLRVSTDRQAEQGFGLDVQEAAIRAWANENGHRVAGWYRDEGVSGSNGLDNRTGLAEALEALRNGKAGALVVYRLDRLAPDLTIQEGTLAAIWSMGRAVFAVDLGEVRRDDPDDPMRTALRQMIGVFAQLERGMIAARMRGGRNLKRGQGGYAGDGPPPYGWKVVRGELVADPVEQVALARMKELRAAGATYRAICSTLGTEGHKPKRGETWHPATVRTILTR